MIRVAMLSFWHVHAKDYVEQAQADPATEIVAVWDETPERGRAEARTLNVPFYEKLDDILARADTLSGGQLKKSRKNEIKQAGRHRLAWVYLWCLLPYRLWLFTCILRSA